MNYDLISIGCLACDVILEIPFIPEINSECFIKTINHLFGGAASNFAIFASYYGDLRVGLISVIGDDEIGIKLIDHMKYYNICTKGVAIINNIASTQIYNLKYPDGHHSYLVFLGALEKLNSNVVPKSYIKNSKLFYIAPAPTKFHKEFINIGYSNNKLIAFNPGSVYIQQESKSLLFELLEFVDFLFLNKEEAINYSNKNTINKAGKELQNFGVNYVIITDGKFGCKIFHNGKVLTFKGYEIGKVSEFGAGDAFAAGFIAEFLKSENLKLAAKSGNLFGAFKASQLESRRKYPNKEVFLDFIKKYEK